MRGPRFCHLLLRQQSSFCRFRNSLQTALLRPYGSANSQPVEPDPKQSESEKEIKPSDIKEVNSQGFFGFFNKFINSGSWSKGESTQDIKTTKSDIEEQPTDPAPDPGPRFSEEFVRIWENHGLDKITLETKKSVILLLRKIHEDLKAGSSIYDAVPKEDEAAIGEMINILHEIVPDDIEDNDEILEVVKLLCGYKGIPRTLRDIIHKEVTERLKANSFSMEQVLHIVSTLVPIALEENKDLLQTLFKIVAKQDQKKDRNQLLTILKVCPKDIQVCFIPDVEKELSTLKFHELFKFTKQAGKDAIKLETHWAQLHEREQLKHKVKLTEMETVLKDFLTSGYISIGCIKVIEKVFHDMCKTDETCLNLEPRIICCALAYFTFTEHYSEHLLELSCSHYVKNQEKYSPEDLAALVKSIGTVNYQPAEDIHRQFFKSVSGKVLDSFHPQLINLIKQLMVCLLSIVKHPVLQKVIKIEYFRGGLIAELVFS